jgi:8-oxo-dGTP pyrophosphatase MutT (NUDIX family)
VTETDPIKTISSQVVYQNPWITVREDKTKTPTGNDGLYGYVESKNSVMVAVVDAEQRVYMVRAFRYPTKTWGWELPGGGGDGEEAVEASQRELEEETGIRAKHWEKIGDTLVCNGLLTERQTVCVATDLSFDGHKEDSDETFGDMRFFSLTEIDGLVDSGEINDNQTITGLFFLQRWLQGKGQK